jgi:Asp-tRNA(Asn)/Glu-tRNA(Gln) amidotransferase A subunit family amidase
MLHNLTGWPALSVPVAKTAAGLPIGVQVAAAPWREDLVLAAGACVEGCAL